MRHQLLGLFRGQVHDVAARPRVIVEVDDPLADAHEVHIGLTPCRRAFGLRTHD